MALMSRNQDTKAGTRAARTRAAEKAAEKAASARARAVAARQRASNTAAQFTPFAESARMTATQGAYQARQWAAPRLDQAGHAIQERIAPGVAGMLSTAARRLEPARSHKRRWPMLAGGIAVLAAVCGAAAFMLSRRGDSQLGEDGPAATDNGEQAADTASADVNGQVRTP